MVSLGVGEVMSWVKLASRMKELVGVFKGRSEHLDAFSKCEPAR